jgi:hypothetical protein
LREKSGTAFTGAPSFSTAAADCPYGVKAGPSIDGNVELHGGFATRDEVDRHAVILGRE